MLIDDMTITVASGKGGDGIVAFNKNMMSLGPTGGSGGNGGNIYIQGTPDIAALNRMRNKKVFKAQDGGNGQRQTRHGNNGEDMVIQVPLGTIVHNLTTQEDTEIISAKTQLLIAKGGHGGKGNFHFRSAANTSPKEFQKGKPGKEYEIRLEVKLIADVGLVGLPNAGKSSLLNELTNANSKIGNYAFTTLEPHLGAHYELIIADLPGILEGASTGKGLGVKFLRHIERTRILFHLVSAESNDVAGDYGIIRKELGAYNPLLLEKEEYLFLAKSDLRPEEETREKLAQLKKLNPNASALSIHDIGAIENAKKILNKIKQQKLQQEPINP
ncbi:MAG: GTPase ObgE [Candidatus Wildermuthbacteria bacterium]|nr:GTPase ObgE [Candidatus Wildermuthbacteria bacterium]